jgi:hypothetical protein
MRTRIGSLVVLWLVGAMPLATLHGQTNFYQYAAKFVCGRATPTNLIVAPGQYFTAINVHNPNGSSNLFS